MNKENKEPKAKNGRGILIAILVFTIIASISNVGILATKGLDYYIAKESIESIFGEAEPQGKGNVGDYKIECKKGELKNDVLNVEIVFENLSDKAASFDSEIHIEAYQDGIEQSSYVDFESLGDDSANLKIKPGKSITINKAYKVKDNKKPVEIEFYLSGNSEPSLTMEYK